MIRLSIVHNHKLVRRSLVTLLRDKDIQVIGEASNGREGIEQAIHLQPDVILIGLMPQGMDGLSATQRLTELKHSARIIVFAAVDQPGQALAARRNGAHGYVILDNNRQELLDAIHTVHAGKLYASPSVAATFMGGHTQRDKPH